MHIYRKIESFIDQRNLFWQQAPNKSSEKEVLLSVTSDCHPRGKSISKYSTWECCRNMDESIFAIYILVSSCHSNRENTGVPHNVTRRSISLHIHEHQTPTILTTTTTTTQPFVPSELRQATHNLDSASKIEWA